MSDLRTSGTNSTVKLKQESANPADSKLDSKLDSKAKDTSKAEKSEAKQPAGWQPKAVTAQTDGAWKPKGETKSTEAKAEGKGKGKGGNVFGKIGGAIGKGVITGVSAAVGGVVIAGGGKIGPHSELPKNMKTFAEFSPKQQALLGSDGQKGYDGLEPRKQAAFIVLTTQMDKLGVDYAGMQLKGGAKGVEVDRFFLEQKAGDSTGQQRFEDSIKAGVKAKIFKADKPEDALHEGMSKSGVRQYVTKESMQIGVGDKGAFVDVDRFNPKKFGGLLGHTGEVFMPGKTDMGLVAKGLKIDLASKQ